MIEKSPINDTRYALRIPCTHRYLYIHMCMYIFVWYRYTPIFVWELLCIYTYIHALRTTSLSAVYRVQKTNKHTQHIRALYTTPKSPVYNRKQPYRTHNRKEPCYDRKEPYRGLISMCDRALLVSSTLLNSAIGLFSIMYRKLNLRT